MGIRAKLALVLSLGIVAATAAASLAFVRLQYAALRESEAEKTQLLLDGIRHMAEEARLAGDPLVLLDYLRFVRRDRPELHHCRVLLHERWQDLGGTTPPEPPGGTSSRRITVPALEGRPGVEVEALLSSRVLEDRERRAFRLLAGNALRSGALVVLAGLLVSALIAGALTRRIVGIEAALGAIADGKLGETVPVHGSDELTRLARSVNAMSEKLQEAEKMKKTFIASVSHELRSPLGAIESQVRELLAAPGSLDGAARDRLDRIRRNAERLEHFVASLLEMAKIERGKLDFTPREEDLGRVVEDVAQLFSAKAREAGVALEAAVEPKVRQVFDPDLVAQVVTNLISNALKFTPAPGRIRVDRKSVV